ncbi:MAG: hypothetical protein P8O11_00120 [Lentibacter sp.]|jgi:hypothetical protein|uniref:hypothetical protein n=1 Tax=Lentibacter sp. TaxID=2024994 RepID=UPI00260D0921|nr:hypothetical protein [Lentibacter sp.]MDG1288118.1 hypothetical protein [Lentibacter sp.]
MALTSTNMISGLGLFQRFSSISDGFVRWMEKLDAQRVEPYRLRIAALHALSDEELEELKLRRENIELHVLNSLFYC